MTFLKKDTAGSDSFGNTWTEDGAVVEVDPEQAAVLLAIPDAGFSEVAEQAPISESPEPEPAVVPPKVTKTAVPRASRTVKE